MRYCFPGSLQPGWMLNRLAQAHQHFLKTSQVELHERCHTHKALMIDQIIGPDFCALITVSLPETHMLLVSIRIQIDIYSM